MNKNSPDHDLIGFVIFGATGDLTRRKLLPALYQLAKEQNLPDGIKIIGFARRPWSDDFLKDTLKKGIDEFSRQKPVDSQVVSKLLENATYVQGEFEKPEGFNKLRTLIEEENIKRVIYYLATPPTAYMDILDNLHICSYPQMMHENGWARIVVEKPYGQDLETAKSLDEKIHTCFKEEQIFRIDHYLGKETVQNILVFRFANGIFEPLWNNHYIDHVQITVAETVGVGTRAGYFDDSGIIRDMFANHMLQLLSLTAMEAPYAFNASSVRDEKLKVLKALRHLKGQKALDNTYRAQYGSGIVNGKDVKAYLDEDRVKDASITETYMVAKLFVDNWRWSGIPFYLRCGKQLHKRTTEIAIQFKQVPLPLFDWHNMAGDAPNVLRLRLQPDEGITLTFGAKVPGPVNEIAPVNMEFCYEDTFGSEPPEAYERLLLDCMVGDATLFTRSDEALAQWEFTSDIMNAWENDPLKKLAMYTPGSWGPQGADEFMQRDGRKWLNPE
ncbi:MAG TPA: glucose-6-phosphate dehydrogenase [Anaerolineaceae bacterium]|nr:glucose-6-phosphate dehydrogenase [Anaerolineaceae bacterium]